MNIIKSLNGRWQFPIAAGVASGYALTCKKSSSGQRGEGGEAGMGQPMQQQASSSGETFDQIIRSHPNFGSVLEATVRGISEGKVTYVDSEGKEKSVQADSVVIYVGLRPKTDEALRFSKAAEQVLSTVV